MPPIAPTLVAQTTREQSVADFELACPSLRAEMELTWSAAVDRARATTDEMMSYFVHALESHGGAVEAANDALERDPTARRLSDMMVLAAQELLAVESEFRFLGMAPPETIPDGEEQHPIYKSGVIPISDAVE